MSLGMEEIQVIELGMMDKRKYYPLTFSSALCMRSFLYPFLLIKTRLQIQAGSQIYRGTFDAFYKIWLREGLSGFYRGYWFSCLQLFPSFVYISSYESVRDCLQHRSAGFAGSRPMLSFVSGGVASVVGQTMAVPIDVVTQHLMLMGQRGSVRGCEGDCRADHRLGSLQPIHTFGQTRRSRFGGVAAVMMEVYRRYGVMGFYKGFFVSLMCFAPNSALWWWFYDIYTDMMRLAVPETVPRLLVCSVAAPASGMSAACLTNLLDVVRARIQVEGGSFRVTVGQLWEEDGVWMVTKGLSARLIHSITFSLFIILGYETIKRWSLLDEYKDRVRW